MSNVFAKNECAATLGRLGGLKGGPARTAALTPERRTELARRAAQMIRRIPDYRDREVRMSEAQRLHESMGVDPGVAEQVLFLMTLPAWERLSRGLGRAKLMRCSSR